MMRNGGVGKGWYPSKEDEIDDFNFLATNLIKEKIYEVFNRYEIIRNLSFQQSRSQQDK